jgi:hypothetical protein
MYLIIFLGLITAMIRDNVGLNYETLHFTYFPVLLKFISWLCEYNQAVCFQSPLAYVERTVFKPT